MHVSVTCIQKLILDVSPVVSIRLLFSTLSLTLDLSVTANHHFLFDKRLYLFSQSASDYFNFWLWPNPGVDTFAFIKTIWHFSYSVLHYVDHTTHHMMLSIKPQGTSSLTLGFHYGNMMHRKCSLSAFIKGHELCCSLSPVDLGCICFQSTTNHDCLLSCSEFSSSGGICSLSCDVTPNHVSI